MSNLRAFGLTVGCKTFLQNSFLKVLLLIQSLTHVQLFATPWTAARQASLSITNSQSLLKLMSIELVLPANHPIHKYIQRSIYFFDFFSTASYNFQHTEPIHPLFLNLLGYQLVNSQAFHEHLLMGASTVLDARNMKIKYKAFERLVGQNFRRACCLN